MPNHSSIHLLAKLEECKHHFGRGEGRRVEEMLAKLSQSHFTDAPSLIRFHEAVLFLRAFPQTPRVISRTEELLKTFHERVEELRSRGADLSAFDTFESSGIAGTTMQDTLSLDVVRWLARRIPRDVKIDWQDYEEERAMASTWPRFLPLLDEDAFVEANIPWQRWLDSASGSQSQLEWLIRRFEQLPLAEREKAELYDSLRLPVSWQLRDLKLSRTRNWIRPRSIYYHTEPLISRRQIDLAHALSQPGPAITKLTLNRGKAVVDLIREVMVVRYRELYGTTLGDPRSMVRAEVGRGVVIHLWNLPPERRLPLRAYIAGFTLKNGVPINYIEAIGLCEWVEVGFNTFYTYRNGETAWIYAQALRCLVQLTGARCISVYPYQLGQENDEAIESGAFWFYRKLGFRPGTRELLRLAELEERQMAKNPRHRSTRRTLRRLAEGHVFYELHNAEPEAWDRFSTRNLGLLVNRRMAQQFGGESRRIRESSVVSVRKALGASLGGWSKTEQKAFEDWALVLALIPDLKDWSRSEKQELLKIVRAKAARDEMRYLHLTQKHPRLRRELLKLGSQA